MGNAVIWELWMKMRIYIVVWLWGKQEWLKKKIVSILGLELVAAVSIGESTKHDQERVTAARIWYFWTDSRVVKGYIANNIRVLMTFVGKSAHNTRK